MPSKGWTITSRPNDGDGQDGRPWGVSRCCVPVRLAVGLTLAWLGVVARAQVAADSHPESDRPSAEAAEAEATDDHPLVHQWDKEGFNFWSESRAALEREEYPDLVNLLWNSPPDADRGLLPDFQDPQLLVPYPTLIALLMQEYPPVREALERQYGELARLRLKTAAATGKLDTLEGLAVQFAGTKVAAEARQRLGDRALAAGHFARALAHYESALSDAAPDERPRIASRLRLAGAMEGRRVGPSADAPVEIGRAPTSAATFEKLIATLADKHAESPGPARAAGLQGAETFEAPLPGRYEMQKWTGLESVADPRHTSPVAAATTADLLVACSNAFAGAWDLSTGAKAWLRTSSDVKSLPSPWKSIPIRPLVVRARVYLRWWGSKGPELQCLDLNDGKPMWSSEPGRYVVSDPLWDRERVFVLAAHRDASFSQKRQSGDPGYVWRSSSKRNTFWLLQWIALDPNTGKTVEQQPLVHLQGEGMPLPMCRAAASDDRIVIVFPGGVLALDRAGRLRWVRRLPWDETLRKEPSGAAWVVDQTVLLVPAGSETLHCLDLRNGRRMWETPVPGTAAPVAVVGQRWIARDDAGLVAVDTRTGQIAWRHAIEEPWENLLCGGLGGLAYATTGTTEVGQWCPKVVWLDPATGQVAASCLQEELTRDRSRGFAWGPMIVVGDRWFAGCRLPGSGSRPWTFHEMVYQGRVGEEPGNGATR